VKTKMELDGRVVCGGFARVQLCVGEVRSIMGPKVRFARLCVQSAETRLTTSLSTCINSTRQS